MFSRYFNLKGTWWWWIYSNKLLPVCFKYPVTFYWSACRQSPVAYSFHFLDCKFKCRYFLHFSFPYHNNVIYFEHWEKAISYTD